MITNINDKYKRYFMKKIKNLFFVIATEKVLSKDWNSKEDDEAWKNL